MSEEALDHLRAMVARLAPDAWLILGEVGIGRYFGSGPDALDAARAFAELNHCALIRDGATIRLGKGANA